jgi:hypothetical protein
MALVQSQQITGKGMGHSQALVAFDISSIPADSRYNSCHSVPGLLLPPSRHSSSNFKQEVTVPGRADVLNAMQMRADQVVPEGTPIIPDGPVALTEDIACFQVAVNEMGYEVKFGQLSAKTIPNPENRQVQLTSRCRVGELTDEFLHVWNNGSDRRGNFLPQARAQEHRFLSRQKHFSGSSNDRRFHQLELANYTHFLNKFSEHIPIFVWKSFIDLARQL